MESINVNYPIIISKLTIEPAFCCGVPYIVRIYDETDKLYTGYIKSVENGNVNMVLFLNDENIDLKYGLYNGCLLEKAMEEAGVGLKQLMGE